MNNPQNTARDYYYDVVAPEEQGVSYHAIHYSQIAKDYMNQPFIQRLFESGTLPEDESLREQVKHDLSKMDALQVFINHTPKVSNHYYIEQCIIKLIENLPSDVFKKRIRMIFVAVRRTYHFNATAGTIKGFYTGDLVHIYQGIMDACAQYAVLLMETIMLRKFQLRGNQDDPQARALLEIVTSHAQKLVVAQMKWQRQDDYILLDPEFMLESSLEVEMGAAKLAQMADRFILTHEIAHHLLGHMGNEDIGLELINRLPERCRMWEGQINPKHAAEFQADALGMLLLANITQGPIREHSVSLNFHTETFMGPLLVLTAIALASKNVLTPSPTHPSIKDRLKQYESIMDFIIPRQDYGGFKGIALSFQGILFQIKDTVFNTETFRELEL